MSDDSDKVNARLGIYGGRCTSGNAQYLEVDRFERTQEPKLTPTDDPLARFVKARIIEAELEPRGEVMALYDEPGGAMAHRYAKAVRRDCVVFRRIVVLYLVARETDGERTRDGDRARIRHGRRAAAHEALLAVANRWSDHRDFDEQWRLT